MAWRFFKLTESDLKHLLTEPIVRDCNYWFAVGLQLGLEYNRLERIEIENQGNIRVCMRKMLITWIRLVQFPTWSKLKQAIELDSGFLTSNMKEHMKSASDDVQVAKNAIHEVGCIIDKWEARDNALHSDLRDDVTKLRGEENWLTTADEWKKENTEWMSGEIATRRKNIQEALTKVHNYKHDTFIMRFLRDKRVRNPSSQPEIVVEGMLRTALAEIDIERLKVLESRYKSAKEHRKSLEELSLRIKVIKRTLEQRLTEYSQIIKRLEELGTKTEKLRKLRDQLKKLREAIDECELFKQECTKVYAKGEGIDEHMKRNLQSYYGSSKDNVKKFKDIEADFSSLLKITAGGAIVGGLATGAATGAVAGTGAFPVLGTTVGAVMGGAAGLFVGLTTAVFQSQSENQSRRNALEEYERTLQRAQTVYEGIQRLLND